MLPYMYTALCVCVSAPLCPFKHVYMLISNISLQWPQVMNASFAEGIGQEECV